MPKEEPGKDGTHSSGKDLGKIVVDRALCISSADCVAIAGGTFQLDDEGIAVVKDLHGNENNAIMEAARACPVKAITIYDEQGNKIYPKD